MVEKFKEIHAPFKGNTKLTAAWIAITAVLIATVYALPLLLASLIASIFKSSDSVTATMASLSVGWLLLLMLGCGIYAVKKFQIKLALFGSAGRTAGAGLTGLINLARGGSIGILLIVPSMFYLIIKFYIAAFIGYAVFNAMLASFILRKILEKMGTKLPEAPVINNLSQAYGGAGVAQPVNPVNSTPSPMGSPYANSYSGMNGDGNMNNMNNMQ